MIPNKLGRVEDLKNRNPEAWKNAHTGNANTEDFVRQLAAELHAEDPKWGLVGKRGNPADISDDALCYFGEGVGHDPTHNNTPITVVDFIAAAGSAAARPAWQVFTDPVTDAGPAAWVAPGSATPVPGPMPTPAPSPKVSREQFAKDFAAVNAFYAAQEGLQRVGGMVSHVDASVFETFRKIVDGSVDDLLTIRNAARQVLLLTCDVEAMAAWGYDLANGAKVEDILAAIKGSDEYKSKHPA